MNFQKKSDSYPFFGRSSITSSHSENTDSHRYVNSFCHGCRALPLRPSLTAEYGYQRIPLCSWILCFIRHNFRKTKMRPPDNARRRTLIFCFPPLALPKSGTVEDLSSSQPVAQAPALMIFISVCKHNTEPLSCQQQKSPRKVRITVTNSAQGKASHTPFIPIYCPAFPVFFPSCQNATALAAATFRESTP